MPISRTNVNLIFWLIFVVILVTMTENYINTTSRIISIGLYSLQTVIIFILALNERQKLISIFSIPSILISTLLLIINFATSPYNPEYSLLLKFFGYIVAAIFGANVAKNTQLRLPKILLYGIIIIPLFLVAFLDNSVVKNTFFPNTNNFVFWGAVASLLYYLSSQNKNKFKYALIILFSYILVGTTIGIVVALFLAIIIINLKSPKSILIAIISIIILLLCIMYSEISVFARIRGMANVMSAVTIEDFKNIENLDIYQFNQYNNSSGGREDGISGLWRIKQWVGVLVIFLKKWESSFILGLGDSFTIFTTGYHPHSDIIRILCEYGFVVFFTFMWYLCKAFKQIKRDPCIYFILTIFIYHFSENLIQTFPTCFIFYFAIGYTYNRIKYLQII